VAKKDKVVMGQKIGEAQGFVSAAVHSPVYGVVKDIALHSHAVFGRAEAVIIDVDPESRSGPITAGQYGSDFDPHKYSAEQIYEAVANAGIVGMGGAGFPTSVKLKANPDSPIDTIIINGCECEPFITCDYRIMLEWTQQILNGTLLVGRALDCANIFIAIEDNKPDAIEAFREAVKQTPGAANVKVAAVETKYPQGGERQLIKAVVDREVPVGGIPPMVNVLVTNVATAAAIADAVVLGRPLTHRVTTVTGRAIARSGNFYVPIGTSVKTLIDFCGGLTDEAQKVLVGGPMTGFSIGDLTVPITKTAGSITVLTEKEMGKAKTAGKETPCIRCGRCIDVCPVNLNPTRIAHSVKHQLFDVAENYHMAACIECGCCSYICPANIEIAGYIKTGKILLARQKKHMPQ